MGDNPSLGPRAPYGQWSIYVDFFKPIVALMEASLAAGFPGGSSFSQTCQEIA